MVTGLEQSQAAKAKCYNALYVWTRRFCYSSNWIWKEFDIMLASLEYLTCCLTKKDPLMFQSHSIGIQMSSRLILACVKTCIHIGLCVGGIITLVSCTHSITVIHFAHVRPWHVTRPFPSLAVGGV